MKRCYARTWRSSSACNLLRSSRICRFLFRFFFFDIGSCGLKLASEDGPRTLGGGTSSAKYRASWDSAR